MFGFTESEMDVFRKLGTPQKIQDYLDDMPINFEENGDTCKSPRMVIMTGSAQCMEGAMFAAAALRINGFEPLIVDMTAASFDYDHVIAVFRHGGFWGAISKTNHAVLRYREPVYMNIRELVMSFFHEYIDSNGGRKAMRSYSSPVNLSRFDSKNWMTSEKDVWYVPGHLLKVDHHKIVNRSQIARFRKPHVIEIKAGNIVQWENSGANQVNNISPNFG